MQKVSVDIWKENIIENLESRSLSYVIVGEFLSDLKEKLGGEKNEIIKVVELKKVEQRSKIIDKFVQEFKRAVRESKYKERLLIEEFKKGMNGVIRKKFMEAEWPLKSIE